jgi:hypothetical protein
MIVEQPLPQIEQKLTLELAPCVMLSAPDWFKRDDFQDWRQGKADGQWCAPACWLPHDRGTETTDVFMTFDRSGMCSLKTIDPGTENHWEGSDADTLPEDIFQEIGRLLREHNLRFGVLWIKPI